MKKTRCPNFNRNKFGEQGCIHPDYDKREELNLCAGMTSSCYVKETNWSIMRDKDGYIWGIAFRGQCVLHINPHTEINIKYVDKFVAMLNKKECVIDIDKKD